MGKRVENFIKLFDKDKKYSLDEAIDFFLNKYVGEYNAKFDETVEFILNLSIDPRHSDNVVRGAVVMPNGVGKDVKVAAIVNNDHVASLDGSGVDFVGGDDLIDKIKGGFLGFDVCVASPDMMPKIGAIAKILGPKGLMPNPKLGTVSDDLNTVIKEAKSGRVTFRADKGGSVHAGVAKLSFLAEKIKQNVDVFYKAVLDAKPSKIKASYVKKAFLGVSQGPSLMLDLKSFVV